jgi:uncharacterized membrane protein
MSGLLRFGRAHARPIGRFDVQGLRAWWRVYTGARGAATDREGPVAVLVWIAASLGFVLLVVVAIVVGALVSLIRVEGRATEPEADEDAEQKAKEKAEERERKHGARGRLSTASYRRLTRTGARELGRMRRHLHVHRLRLEAVVASEDPVLTGEVYGVGCAALGAIRGIWPHADVRLDTDFVATEPSGAAEAALRLRPVRLVPSLARVGWAYWRERRRSRRRA